MKKRFELINLPHWVTILSNRSVLQLLLFVFFLGFSTASFAQASKIGIFDKSEDIGTCLIKGSSQYDGDKQEYILTGAGANMWFEKDAFHFLYKKMKGDFILQFEFSFVGEAKNPHRKVGWMVRNDTTENSEHINGTVHNDGLTSIQYRLAKGANTLELKSPAKSPTIIQLERRGNLYILSTANKGQDFTRIELMDSTTVIHNEALVGMFICSHEENYKETAIIRNVRVTVPPFLLLSEPNTYATDIYKGKAWKDSTQQIPGKIQCELYDQGGEGIAYHDTDSTNNGSGMLNPANGTFLNEFRMQEGVDISYTKSDSTDNNPYNLVEPEMGQLYVGWTHPDEWINYTINVSKTGTYTMGIMYTASGDGSISLDMDGKKLTAGLRIPSTRSDIEPLAWRQWHHWNRIDTLVAVKLEEGTHVLTLKTVTNGNMNYDYLDFKLIDKE